MKVTVFGFKILDDDLCSMGMVREIVAEIVGTFFLIFIGAGAVSQATGGGKFLQIGLAFGLGIGAAVHLFSDISGGQLNPAVSFGLFFARKLSLVRALVLTVAQVIGGLVGAGILKGILGKCPGSVALNTNLSPIKGFALEFFGTLFLVMTVLASINEKRGHAPGYLQPYAIGVSIFVMHMFLIPLTGCGINPARSLATNLVAGTIESNFWIYVLGPITASVVGGVLYEFFFNYHYDKDVSSSKHEALRMDEDGA